MNCIHCDKPTGNLKFCSNVCQHAEQREQRIAALKEGRYVGQVIGFNVGSWTRNLLIDLLGYRCNACSISEWNEKSITLEVNHKDGNAANNALSNLEFLCPNCHSQTPTFRAKNRGKSARTNR